MPDHIQARACKNCHHVGVPTMPGSGWIELVLWCCYFIPGFVYSLWRRGPRSKSICPLCGAPNMLSLNTPLGAEIASRDNSATFVALNEGCKPEPAKKSWGGIKWFFIFFLILMLLQPLMFSVPQDLAIIMMPLSFVAALLGTLGLHRYDKRRASRTKK